MVNRDIERYNHTELRLLVSIRNILLGKRSRGNSSGHKREI